MVPRAIITSILLVTAGCGTNPVDPRLIPGGGVGDGPIEGEANIYVIDGSTGAPLASAAVVVGATAATTDATGLVIVDGIDGPQTVIASIGGYRSTVWVGVNGANITVPLTAARATAPAQATLSGTIPGFAAIGVPDGHVKAAFVAYSHTGRLGDPANGITTPAMGNVCVAMTPSDDCAWTLASRTGQVAVVATVVDFDANGTSDPSDDITTVIGWAHRTGVTVAAGVAQTGLSLTLVPDADLVDVAIDFGTPPPGLPDRGAHVGLDLGADGTFDNPVMAAPDQPTARMPPLAAFPGASYTLFAQATDTARPLAPFSVVLRSGTGQDLTAGAWLTPPTDIAMTRTGATWTPVAGALAHTITYRGGTGDELLELTVFDPAVTTVDVPALVALPATGTLHASVGALAADFTLDEFQLDEDFAKIHGVTSQPVDLP